MVESGPFYKTFIDPLIVPMRRHVAAYIQPGEKVVDIACGTGAQVFEFSEKAVLAVGVDLSESMIARAEKTKLQEGFTNTEFYVADAAKLSIFKDKEFDVATMSLALHQFDPEFYNPILNEMKRIADRIIITDYSIPLPKGIKGGAAKLIEFLAGREHNRNFRKFYKAGGLVTITKNHGLKTSGQKKIASGIFCINFLLPENINTE